jgi:uncharacterized protein
MFRRRVKRTYTQWIGDSIYPQGGWKRAINYLVHRVRRLPDTPHRVARGSALGVFLAFSPFFGLHLVAALIAPFLVRGNVIASVLTSFVGNPITWPFIIPAALGLGRGVLGSYYLGPDRSVPEAVGHATSDLWHNFMAIFTSATAQWQGLLGFWHEVFLPYLVGGGILGLFFGGIAYVLTLRLLNAYQIARYKKFQKRREARDQARGSIPNGNAS